MSVVYSRVKPKDLTLEPTDRAVALPSTGQAFLFFGPCGVVKSILYKEELQPEEEASEAEISGERNDAEEVGGGEESETPLNAARPDGSEEDSGESPLLIRRHNDDVGDEARSPILASSREGTPVPIGEGAAQIGTSSRGSTILRRVPGVNFPDKVSFHYEGPAPLVYVPEKCGEFLRQLRGRAKPLPAVKDLIFGSEYEEAVRAKLLGDSATNVMIDKYDTALKGALGELELAKKEHAEREEASARQLVARIIARRDELKAEPDSGESSLLIRRHNDEVGDEARSPILASSREGTPVPIGEGAAQIGTSSRGSAILRRVPGVNFPDKVSFHYEGPAPLVYVPEKCGEFLRQLRGRAKPLPAVKDLIFGSEYEEAARAKLLGDSATNVVIDKYDTALKGALGELDLAKKEHAEREEASARQLNASRADVERLNGMVIRIIARRDELKAELEASRGIVPRLDEVHVSAAARESSARASELSALNDPTIEIFAEQEKKYEQEAEKLRVGEIPEEDLTLSPLVLDSQFMDARILASLDPYGSNAGLIDPETAASLHVLPTHPTEARREDPTPLLEGPLADPEIIPRSDEARVSPVARESSVRASELSVLNDHESGRED
ncbi:hypothetical protein DY000_02059002 [Brassica cretica]|uniref:Uncharacterized protein n=1 Tax=Brassica cretica TaxID=69181 RepID=A0ABQ7AZK2_BRACR|nr:hypothetical protein DY000_02059002 [Brassica cretica]